MLRNLGRGAFAGLVVLAGGACGDDEQQQINNPPPQVALMTAYVESIKTLDGSVAGTFVSDSAPTPDGGPTATVGANGTVVWGGAQQTSLSGSGDFRKVIVSVDGAAGHYSIDLGADTADVELVLTYATRIPATNFDLRFQLETQDGTVGDVVAQNMDRVAVGTGVVQVTVTWNTGADLDLHLVEPSGEEIFFDHTAGDKDIFPSGAPSSASGGELDLTSNLDCADGSRNENIYWSNNALSGMYTVRLALISPCGAAASDYVVTVRMQGRAPLQFKGTIDGPPTGGNQGAGYQVGTFLF
jgi:hypothetical protein